MIPVERTSAGIRRALEPHRRKGPIGFVPTMGALHAGHTRLIVMAREHASTVIVSIFVNPLQFDQPADYERYERTLNADVRLAEEHGADLIFAPSAEEMYSGPPQTFVEVQGLTEHFCGASRPGHFRGVTTVVSKLFHIIQPDLALFGEKDAQQLAVIERMVLDLDFPIRIVPVATVREPDGLALSSRNARLSTAEREIAPCLYEALDRARHLIRSGARDSVEILAHALTLLSRPGVRVDYLDLADPKTMRPVTFATPPVRAMGAIFVGATRLIDNLYCL